MPYNIDCSYLLLTRISSAYSNSWLPIFSCHIMYVVYLHHPVPVITALSTSVHISTDILTN